jgi:hypothetical protein
VSLSLAGSGALSGVDLDALTATGRLSGALLPFGVTLQVVQTVKNDTFTTASTTFVDVTDLSVSITPSSSSSKILVMAQVVTSMATAGWNGHIRLMRDSTAINVGAAAGSRKQASGTLYIANTQDVRVIHLSFLDNPSTDSEVVYKIQAVAQNASHIFCLNRSGLDTDSADLARYASTIAAIEVAA